MRSFPCPRKMWDSVGHAGCSSAGVSSLGSSRLCAPRRGPSPNPRGRFIPGWLTPLVGCQHGLLVCPGHVPASLCHAGTIILALSSKGNLCPCLWFCFFSFLLKVQSYHGFNPHPLSVCTSLSASQISQKILQFLMSDPL